MSRLNVMPHATRLRLWLSERIAPPGAIVLPPRDTPRPSRPPLPDDWVAIYEPKDEADRDRYLTELHKEHQR